MLAVLRDDHGVRWSATTLRAVIAEVATGMEVHGPGGAGRPTPRLAGAGGPILGGPQAGAGGGARAG